MSRKAPETPAPATGSLSRAEESLRSRHWVVVQKHAAASHLEVLRRFHGRQFEEWLPWFPGLTPPVPRLSTPSHPRAYGTYASVAGDGLKGEIRLRPTILDGRHPHFRRGEKFLEGRLRFLEDILLHETVHAFNFEITGQPEPSYKGHGPAFAARCNVIGAALGLPRVRPAKKRGKDKTLPSCAQWPHNVRPKDYYLGALAEAEEKTGEETEPEAEPGSLVEAYGEWKTAGAKLASLVAAFPQDVVLKALEWTITLERHDDSTRGAIWGFKGTNGVHVTGMLMVRDSASGDTPPEEATPEGPALEETLP